MVPNVAVLMSQLDQLVVTDQLGKAAHLLHAQAPLGQVTTRTYTTQDVH